MAKALANKKPRYNQTKNIVNEISIGKEKSFTELENIDKRELNEVTGIKRSASPHCTRVAVAVIIVIIVAICLVIGVVFIFKRNQADEDKDSTPSTTSRPTLGTYCKQNCRNRPLDNKCEACFCGDNEISGRVFSKTTGNPIGSVALFSKADPTFRISLSNLTGHFSLEANCAPLELYSTKEGFVNTKVDVDASYFEIHMPRIVKPYFTETPQSKNRLTAENVTLCCIASANPEVLYYEWYKNHILMDGNAYINQTELVLTNLSVSDSGKYQCKAHSIAGVIMSDVADLSVKVEPNDFCKEALQPKLSQLPDDCFQEETNSTLYEVHECLGVRCRNYSRSIKDNCRDEINFCCSMKDFQVVKVNCSDYIIELVDVVSCECNTCQVSKVIVSGTATGQRDGAPVKFGTVYANGVMKGQTSDRGAFQFSFEPLLSEITINILDNIFNEFLPAVKIIRLSDVVPEVLKVEVKMIRAADPVKINSSVENMIQTGSSSNSNLSNILLDVPANAFYFQNGSQFTGIVDARLTFLDPSNISTFDDIPGTFEFIDEEGEAGRLASLGVFNLYFEDSSGNPLMMNKVINAYIPQTVDEIETFKNFKLWTLNFQTGLWEIERTTLVSSRKKRYSSLSWVGALADISIQKWYNYDEVYEFSNSTCYFTFDLYESRLMDTTVTSIPTLKFEIYIIRGRVAHAIRHYTSQKKCLNIACENDEAYITVFSYRNDEPIYIGGFSQGSDLAHSISPDERVLKTVLSSSSNGPFYNKISQCSTSNSYPHIRAFYYGSSEYAWKFNEKSTTCILNESPEFRMRTWYQYHMSAKYKVCFVKVRVDIDQGLNFIANKMKIRVFSYGGDNPSIKDKILGIHETKLLDSRNTYCIEYRCSGAIDICNSQLIDKTKVKIILQYPSRNGVCNVYKKADVNTLYQSDGQFTFYANIDDGGPTKGIYLNRGEPIDIAKSMSKDYCEKAHLPPESFNKPASDDGFVVAFRCSKT